MKHSVRLVMIISVAVLLSPGASMSQADDGNIHAYVAMGSANQIIEIDLASHKILRRLDGGVNPHGLAVTPNGRLLVAASRAASPKKKREAKHSEDKHHHDEAAETESAKPPEDPNAGKATIIEARSGRVITHIDVGGGSHHAAVTRDGKFAVLTVPSQKGIVIISTSTQEIVGTLETGAGSNYALASRDGKAVYVSNTGEGTITSINPIFLHHGMRKPDKP